MENSRRIPIEIKDNLSNVIALIAFLQQVSASDTLLSDCNDSSIKTGLFLYITDIHDKLKEVERQLGQL